MKNKIKLPLCKKRTNQLTSETVNQSRAVKINSSLEILRPAGVDKFIFLLRELFLTKSYSVIG